MDERFADKPEPYQQARYLLELSERVFCIAPIHGVDQGDYDTLRAIAHDLCPEAVADHIAEFDE